MSCNKCPTVAHKRRLVRWNSLEEKTKVRSQGKAIAMGFAPRPRRWGAGRGALGAGRWGYEQAGLRSGFGVSQDDQILHAQCAQPDRQREGTNYTRQM